MIAKLLITITFLAFSFLGYAQSLTSPQETFRTYLKAMVQVKKDQNISKNYKVAISTLDLSHLDPAIKDEIGKTISNYLIEALDRLEKIDYNKIPQEVKGTYWLYKKIELKSGGFAEISMELKDSKWLFSKETTLTIKALAQELKNKDIVEGVQELKTFSTKFKKSLPSWVQKINFYLQGWQWALLFSLILFAYFFQRLLMLPLGFLVSRNFAFLKKVPKKEVEKSISPFGKIVLFFIILGGIHFLELSAPKLILFKRILTICYSVAIVFFAYKFVKVISYYFLHLAHRTDSKFDDILIPLLTKTAYVIVFIVGIVLIANAFTIDITGLIAGLGIGGLAFAFAAKDTIANFFGSIMLVLDRPFDIGDFITSGDVEGIVSEVGFRSTRIRTFDDSIITISNGELMNRSIDNKGKRRFRRLSTTIGLEYNTPPEKVEEFCEGVRQLILAHKWTRKDNFYVYFTNFAASSLDIQLVVYWCTADYMREQAEKHRMMIDILRLAEQIGVSFAFPTQTVHLFNEDKKEKAKFDPKSFLDQGILSAKKVAESPISLKNPRSNFEDKDQFGNNDLGL